MATILIISPKVGSSSSSVGSTLERDSQGASPLVFIEDHRTRQIRALPPQMGQAKDPPRNHHITCQCWFERFLSFELDVFNLTAGLQNGRVMPKAIRHSFGIGHAQTRTPSNMTQRWFGHAKIETTHIYMNASGEEERALASSVWPSFSSFLQNNF